MISHDELNSLRKLVKSSQTAHLYNIMGAIRGADVKEEQNLKALTIAIRTYIGFGYKNCPGSTSTFEYAVQNAIDKIKTSGQFSRNHYQFHLLKALESIGEENLMAHVRRYQ